MVRKHPTELRADLQMYYGVDLDRAQAGEHTAGHVAALAVCMPSDSAVMRAENQDAVWTLDSVLLAVLHNDLTALMWGMSDPVKRGAKPPRIGPSWLVEADAKKLDARVLSIDELIKELNKQRR